MSKARPIAVGIGILVGVTLVGVPAARQAGWLPARWEEAGEGPIEGVVWKPFPNSKVESPAGEIVGWGQHISNPNDFVFRVPEPFTKVTPYLVVNGHEVPLELNMRFRDPRFRSVQPIREYPPNLDRMELVVKTMNGGGSRFILRDLPPTRYRFPVEGPEVWRQTVDGVHFEASAWTESPWPKGYPYVAGAVRIAGGLPPGNWEWRGVTFELPFQSTDEPKVNPGSMSGRMPKTFGIGASASHPWASWMRRVRMKGRVAEFEEVRETVDFGEFNVALTSEWANNDFKIDLRKPIERTTPLGARIRLEPITLYNYSHGKPIPSKLHLRVELAPDTVRSGVPERLKNTKGEVEALLAIPSQERSTLPSISPNPKEGPNIFLTYPGLKPGRIRLKLDVIRRFAVREYPFELTPDVRPRTESPDSTRFMRTTLTPTQGSFDPRPEDFPARVAAHN